MKCPLTGHGLALRVSDMPVAVCSGSTAVLCSDVCARAVILPPRSGSEDSASCIRMKP